MSVDEKNEANRRMDEVAVRIDVMAGAERFKLVVKRMDESLKIAGQ